VLFSFFIFADESIKKLDYKMITRYLEPCNRFVILRAYNFPANRVKYNEKGAANE